MTALGDRRRDRLARARLYVVTDARDDRGDLDAFLEAILSAGVDIVQLREKEAEAGDLLRWGARFRDANGRHGALFVVNDRPDIAVAARADGVHLGQEDMAVDDARAIVGPELLIGRSTHSPQQVDGAAGADYIGVGPVHATPTKLGRPAVGVDLVRYAAAHARVPFFAIGGLDATTLPDAVRAGATRAAVVRAISEAADPEAAARALRAALAVPVG